MPMLDEVAMVLETNLHRCLEITIEPEDGERFDRRQSLRRAAVVRDYLVSKGIDADRLKAAEYVPAAAGVAAAESAPHVGGCKARFKFFRCP